jgi:hypothetical protein
MTIFFYTGSGKKWQSHGGGRRCFASNRCWSRRRQMLVAEMTDAGPASVSLPQVRSTEEEATDARMLTRQTLASACVA